MTTMTIEVSDELAQRIQKASAGNVNTFAVAALVRALETQELTYTAEQLLALPLAERHAIMRRQAEAAVGMYEADLALPVEQRELTAFTALEDPILEPEEYMADIR